MEKQRGIVLKKYNQYGNRFVILDRKLGKIIGIADAPMLRVGSVICYIATARHQSWFLSHIELIELPLHIAKDDILFLHHILEVTYYFLPLGSSCRQIFDTIVVLYGMPAEVSDIVKKSLLFKFYTMLGLHAQEGHEDHLFFVQLATESVDTIAQKILDLGMQTKLSAWLYSCIAVHPHARYFKTIHFLEK